MKTVEQLVLAFALLMTAWGVVTVAQSHHGRRECAKFSDEYRVELSAPGAFFATRDCLAWK